MKRSSGREKGNGSKVWGSPQSKPLSTPASSNFQTREIGTSSTERGEGFHYIGSSFSTNDLLPSPIPSFLPLFFCPTNHSFFYTSSQEIKLLEAMKCETQSISPKSIAYFKISTCYKNTANHISFSV